MQKSGVTLSLCPLFQTTSPGVDGIVEILPLTLHISNIPLAERSGQLFEAYLFSVVPLAVQKKALIRPTQSATIRPPRCAFCRCWYARSRSDLGIASFFARTETASPDSRTSHTSISSPPPVPFPQKPPTGGLCTSPWLSLLTRQDAALCRAP